MTYDGPWMINDAAKDNPYQYNGKELNLDHGLNWSDYGARFYDACVGRWSSVDPMAEAAPDWTPYRYGFNNPMSFTDPTGMFEGHGLGGRNRIKDESDNNIDKGMTDQGENNKSDESSSSQSNSSAESGCGGPGQPPCENKGASVGESFVPFYGSYLDMMYRWEKGEYLRSAGNFVLMVTDVALVKSLVVGASKGGLKALGKNFTSWSGSGWRKFYGKEGFASAGQHLHHWAWFRNGATKGEGFGWWAKNQMWNLMPMANPVLHNSVHGKGILPFGPVNKFIHGTPQWFKLTLFSGGSKVYSASNNGDGSW